MNDAKTMSMLIPTIELSSMDYFVAGVAVLSTLGSLAWYFGGLLWLYVRPYDRGSIGCRLADTVFRYHDNLARSVNSEKK